MLCEKPEGEERNWTKPSEAREISCLVISFYLRSSLFHLLALVSFSMRQRCLPWIEKRRNAKRRRKTNTRKMKEKEKKEEEKEKQEEEEKEKQNGKNGQVVGCFA